MRRVLAVSVVLLVGAGEARAHSPATAIGRAVEAFGQVAISYDPGSVVSDVRGRWLSADRGHLCGQERDLHVTAEDEILGGPGAVASEIAYEAGLDGTLVVLVGTRLGAWSADIGDDRLAELVRNAGGAPGGSPAAAVENLGPADPG
ncbi:MAG: hypothetical protein ACRDNY_04425 [Gaiellaceae bacterium]